MTPAQRAKLYPAYVGLITMKSSGKFVIDCDLIEQFIEKVNDKWLVRLKDYWVTVHAFDIGSVQKVPVGVEHMNMIDKLKLIWDKLKFPNTLSLSQSIQWLKSPQNLSLN